MKIEREIINRFIEWKEHGSHKPILLKGARQIGKTWAMEEFGQNTSRNIGYGSLC
ncbi:MAG: hypothetical protein K2L00_03065 [Muribaculaceae bacterium]|nr:hypothetical protein [Muribaculaceae bacterium]